jgi:hypothetical protein
MVTSRQQMMHFRDLALIFFCHRQISSLLSNLGAGRIGRRIGLRYSSEFYFVTPAGMLSISEIPVRCGYVLQSAKHVALYASEAAELTTVTSFRLSQQSKLPISFDA